MAEALARVRSRIERAGGDPGAVTVVAVTKGHPVERVAEACAAGVTDLGENYAAELLAKQPAAPAARWHFLGAVQRGKVRALAPAVACWQGVDRLAAGREIARRAPGASVLVQVDVAGRPDRNGCRPEEAEALIAALRDLGLAVDGLMAVGRAEDPRPGFRLLADLGRRAGVAHLSMGMSGDLEVAVQEGATMVRVGDALFGPRPGRADLRRYPQPEGGR